MCSGMPRCSGMCCWLGPEKPDVDWSACGCSARSPSASCP
jgi:hypothetical protein